MKLAKQTILIFILLCTGVMLCAAPSVNVGVSSQDVYIGDAFIYRITVNDSNDVKAPDMSAVEKDFIVKEAGSGAQNSTSVQYINGKMTKDIKRAYILNYRLTAKRTGSLRIPSVEVIVENQQYRTNPVPIRAREPEKTVRQRVVQKLSQPYCYVGEPVTLEVDWTIMEKVDDFNIMIPAFNLGNFSYEDIEPDMNRGRDYIKLEVNGEEIIAEQSRGRYKNQNASIIKLKKIIIPQKPGLYDLKKTSIVSQVVTGYNRSRGGFFSRQQAQTKTAKVESNPLLLTVKELPKNGQPANFAGHVGRYKITTSATPREVNVGDPITLTITISGSEFLKDLKLPPLEQQPELAKNFRLPTDMASGEIKGKTKVFTQTIRAQHPDITEIPPISLPYFDSKTEKYEIAQSRPIPISVKATKIVSADDAIGSTAPVRQNSNKKLNTWTRGIAHNYEGHDILKNQQISKILNLSNSKIMTALIAPPALFFTMLILTIMAGSKRDPLQQAARKALSTFNKNIHQAISGDFSYADTLSCLQQYFGDKFKQPGGALTAKDIHIKLQELDVPEELCREIEKIYEACEAGQYAGGAFMNKEDIKHSIVKTVKSIDKVIK